MPEQSVRSLILCVVAVGFGVFSMVRHVPAQATRSDTAKESGAAQSDVTQKPPAAKSEVGVKPEAAQSTPGQADGGGGRNPMKQLSRQYARRAAAKSQERAEATKTPPPASEIREPVVALSQGHRDSCVAFLGDSLPATTLPDAAGTTHELLKSLGSKLTVVILWSADNPYALDQFQEVQHELVPLTDQGVQAVAIHVGMPPSDYVQLCADNGKGALCLLDADKGYFAKLARVKLPRTYLLDAQGKILWLDLEYSRSTRYDLRNALHFYLK